MAAPKARLGELHRKVTEAYIAGIDADMEDDIFNPALLSGAAKFLKDNEITAEIKSDDDLSTMREKLVAAEEERKKKARGLLHIAGSMPQDEVG